MTPPTNPAVANDRGETALGLRLTPLRFAGVLGVLIFLAYPGVLVGLKTFIGRDFGYFGYPLAQYYRDCLWRGEWPLWNPLNHCGLPFLAQWNTLGLYPGSLWYLVLPLPWSLNTFCLAHQFLAGLGMFFLARHWTNSALAAAVAGTAYAFNGLVQVSLMWPNNIAALGWMPWVVLATGRAAAEGGRRVWSAALIGALQMLTGAPEVILLTWLVSAGNWLVRRWAGWRAAGRELWRLGAVGVLVSGLAAAQLLPFLDLMAHSQREPGFAATEWAMPWWGWANLVVPLFRCFVSSQGVYFQPGQLWTASYYPGIVLVALACLALVVARQRRVWLLAGLCLLGLILALGPPGWVYAALNHWLPLDVVRFPVKYVVLASFGLPLLAAHTIGAGEQAVAERRRFIWEALLVVGVGFLFLVVFLFWFSWNFPRPSESLAVTADNGLIRLAFLALTLAVLALCFARGPRLIRDLLGISACVLVAADLITHAPRLNPTAVPSAFDPGVLPTEARTELGQSRTMLTPAAKAVFYQTDLADPLTSYVFHRLGLCLNVNLLEGVPKVEGFFSLYLKETWEVREYLDTVTNLAHSPLADFLGVTQIPSDTNLLVWQARTTALPWITAGQRPIFDSPRETLRALAAPDFAPRQVVYLPPAAQSLALATNPAVARIAGMTFRSHRVAFECVADQPAWVVIAQSYYHPWQAAVDGAPVRLWRANHAFQALEVPAGRHRIELAYRDRRFQIGVAISLATLALCGVGWTISSRRRVEPASLTA